MSIGRRWSALGRIPAVKTGLFVVGCLLILLSPLVGAIPGPGGIIVFAAGLGLVLKYSGWAKRKYVAFKRRYPNKGAWADWGLRRRSARQRLERERALAEKQARSDAGAPASTEGQPCGQSAADAEIPRAPRVTLGKQTLGD